MGHARDFLLFFGHAQILIFGRMEHSRESEIDYVQLHEELVATPFSQVFVICNHILNILGFEYSFISGAFVNGPKVVIMCYIGDEFCVIGKNWRLTLHKSGNVMQFFTDFYPRVAI